MTTSRALIAAVLTLVLAACGREAPKTSVVMDEGGAPARAGVVASEMQAAPPPAIMPAAATPGDSLPASMIIRTGTAEVEVETLEPAVDSVRMLVARLEGHVVDLSLQVGEAQRRQARIVARIPSARFDGAVAGLSRIGDVETVNVSAQDVGEEYVDIQAQVTNRRRLEARLLDLLDTRTGKLEDVLAVERELARVREEIDRQEGRLRYLRNQVAMSTLTIVLHEPAPLISTAGGENVFLAALRSAWRNFIAFSAALIASLGVLAPVGALAWLAWLVVKRVRRRRTSAKE